MKLIIEKQGQVVRGKVMARDDSGRRKKHKIKQMTALKYTFIFFAAVAIQAQVRYVKFFLEYYSSSYQMPQMTVPPTSGEMFRGSIAVRGRPTPPENTEPKSKRTPELKLEPKPKPKLILHVGPQKTASTNIQYLLSDNEDVRRALAKDNYTVVEFNYRKSKRLFYYCFSNQTNCELWDSILAKFDEAYENGNGVIWSNEELVNLPTNDFTTKLWRNLLDRWDVRVIMFYRPFHEWIYSYYIQERKSLMTRAGEQVWIEHFGQQERVKNFPEWLADHVESDASDLRDIVGVQKSFVRLFGAPERVHVLDMISPYGVEITFLANDVVEAVHAQEVVEQTEEVLPVKNPQSSKVLERIDTDLIIVQAHRQHLGDLGLRKGGRNTARIKLEGRLKDWNMTVAELPTVCVSKDHEEWLYSRTLYLQKMYSFFPLPEKKIQTQFAADRKKWCGVDARAVLQRDSVWNEYLSSCEFEKSGCDIEE